MKIIGTAVAVLHGDGLPAVWQQVGGNIGAVEVVAGDGFDLLVGDGEDLLTYSATSRQVMRGDFVVSAMVDGENVFLAETPDPFALPVLVREGLFALAVALA